jgi:hypothetical protein
MKHVLVALAMIAGGAGTAAHAEPTIFRCGQEYTSVACADGKALVVAAAVSAEQRAEARQVASRERALAAEMTRDRRAEEAAFRPALAGSLSGPRAAATAPAEPTKKHARKRSKMATLDEERDFIAAVPRAKKAER